MISLNHFHKLLWLTWILTGCHDSGNTQNSLSIATLKPLIGEQIDRSTLRNPYAHIPAQCYIETSGGTQNACLYCHTNGLFNHKLGNNAPQAGYEPLVGDLQQEYAFAALRYPHFINGSITPWENTLFPEKLHNAVSALNINPENWDMQAYIRQDNWTAAYQQRPNQSLNWDTGVEHQFRLFPGLDPVDLPANDDGFVRSRRAENGFFRDERGYITGWRAINFMPYGIFTPNSGSVSGIYLRLPSQFMQDTPGHYDLATYQANLDLLARAIQDRLQPNDSKNYLGAAMNISVQRGLYPIGTEFAHPLHYVDIAADGHDSTVSPFPGMRARRVKEIRYMYKYKEFSPEAIPPGEKDEGAPMYAHRTQGWIDNGVGWYLAGYIEDAQGMLRPQTPNELLSCVGCHSGNVFQESQPRPIFTAGTGNTIDSTWALPRQWAEHGWGEMDYLGYQIEKGSQRGDPLNRGHQQGEFRFFLDHVVGASLYGDMPTRMENFLATMIRVTRGYRADWAPLDIRNADNLLAQQQERLKLIREFTARDDYLDNQGHIHTELLYPLLQDSLANARNYRQVVVTQRYELGKDVFAETPFTFRHYRQAQDALTHQNGQPYQFGEIITDRPIDPEPSNFTYGVGVSKTLINKELSFEQGGTYYPDYIPLLK